MKARDLIKLLEKDGWRIVRQSGSHKIFKHSHKKGTISIPDHGKQDIKIGTLKAILKQAEIH
jgi:predicted RNA binding protein YcfA (HicA-like mRNA interferase family)